MYLILSPGEGGGVTTQNNFLRHPGFFESVLQFWSVEYPTSEKDIDISISKFSIFD